MTTTIDTLTDAVRPGDIMRADLRDALDRVAVFYREKTLGVFLIPLPGLVRVEVSIVCERFHLTVVTERSHQHRAVVTCAREAACLVLCYVESANLGEVV